MSTKVTRQYSNEVMVTINNVINAIKERDITRAVKIAEEGCFVLISEDSEYFKSTDWRHHVGSIGLKQLYLVQ